MSSEQDVGQRLVEALENVDWKRVEDFTDEIRDESDRAAIVLGTALVHECLRALLQKALVPPRNKEARKGDIDQDELLGIDRPLSTLSACSNACYRLGLISDAEAENMKWIGKIRNDFSHKPGTSNADAEPYRSWIDKLAWPIHSPTFQEEYMRKHFGEERTPRVKLRSILVLTAYVLHSQAALIGGPLAALAREALRSTTK